MTATSSGAVGCEQAAVLCSLWLESSMEGQHAVWIFKCYVKGYKSACLCACVCLRHTPNHPSCFVFRRMSSPTTPRYGTVSPTPSSSPNTLIYDTSDSDAETGSTRASESNLAPSESVGLLGREVTLLSAIMLNVGQMTGSGIYAVPGVIMHSVGSVGLLLMYWIISPLFALWGLSVYAEYASLSPHRSGGEVVFLEQAFPKPRFLAPIVCAPILILTSLNVSNAIIFAQYFLVGFNVPVTTFMQTLVSLLVVSVTAAIVIFSTRWALWTVNVLTTLKMVVLAGMVACGVAVFAGITHVQDPYMNFRHPFEGSYWNGNALATAFVKSSHAFNGWSNAFNVIGEIKSHDPARTVRKSSRIALLLVSALFLFINIAYIAAIPAEDMRQPGELIGVLFFRRVFGSADSAVLPLLVALNCFGSIVAVTLSQARVLREIARQGLLPYPAYFSSVKPFGTPLRPLVLRSCLVTIMLVAIPAKDAFNFILDLVSYPNLVFQSALAYGLFVIRRHRSDNKLPPAPLTASSTVVVLYLAGCLVLLILPWVPPARGHADVSFWYATYCVAGIAMLLICGLYYWVWMVYLPKRGNYEIVEEVQESLDGERNTKLTRRYKRFSDENDERQPLLSYT